MPTLLHHFITQAAKKYPTDNALLFKDQAINYQQLYEQLISISNAFIRLGINRSERIATYLPKRIETVVSMFSASAAGVSFVPINPILKAEQVTYILNDCNVRLLITTSDRLKQLQSILGNCADLHTVIILDSPKQIHSDELSHIKLLQWQNIQSEHTSLPDIANIDTDIAAILYTSGSTGKPKGVVLSHYNMVAGAKSVAGYLKNTRHDRILAVLPFSFDYGLSQLTTAFSVGASVTLMDYLFPRDVIKAVSKYQITGLAAVPPLWIQLAQLQWPEETMQTLRYFTNSGGALPVEVLNSLRQALPDTSPYLMYGLTEAFRSTYVPPENLDSHQDSIGIAIPNAEVLVLREDGSECADNEPGELVHRGSLVSMGYWNAPEKTQQHFKPFTSPLTGKILPEYAVWSGDTVRRDKDGFLYFISRKDDMIKTSGYRVSPNEVEEVVYQSNLIKEAVALGIKHPMLGQAVVLVVIPGEKTFATKELLAYCKKNLPNFMHPAEIIVKNTLERNQNGKIDRKLLAQEFQTLFLNKDSQA